MSEHSSDVTGSEGPTLSEFVPEEDVDEDAAAGIGVLEDEGEDAVEQEELLRPAGAV